MAPLRRYLRITKYSVLECRIYVDNPALVHSWLLHPRDPVLPRVIESVRPLVLPKLMEERDRASNKNKKKNKGAIRDVLVERDFEVSLFLVETNTRHSLLYKHRRARDKTQTRLVSNSRKLTGGEARDAPIDVDAEGAGMRIDLGGGDGQDNGDGDDDHIVLTAEATGLPRSTRETSGASAVPPPNLLVEDSDDEDGGGGLKTLQAIPDIRETQTENAADGGTTQRRSKRHRQPSRPINVDNSDGDDDDENGSLFGSDGGHASISDDNDDDNNNNDSNDAAQPPRKRPRVVPVDADDEEQQEGRKKKKLAMDVIYEGFAIYGRVLCLVVKQRGVPRGRRTQALLPTPAASAAAAATPSSTAASTQVKPGGQASMENWIASTQAPLGGSGDD